MKTLIGFLSVLLCVAPFGVADAVVSQTAGSNLTAYNGESGSTNNNRWNTLMNIRGGTGTSATADFGNCNALILRCAQPKCNNGGCVDMDVTSAIVSGCVQSNASCRQYGDDLVDYISAQLVAQSTAKANAAQSAAQTAAAQQSAQQLQQMQAQMQQMQTQMAQQNAETAARLQSALDEQKQLTANAIAEAAAARETSAQSATVSAATGLTDAQLSAAQNDVDPDIIAREQISGQILSAIENAQQNLKNLKTTMTNAFSYAGCDSRGGNCRGPKRVKIFKQKAESFFDPYEGVLDELYDALVLAQSVGVDITDIYMMLNGSCNVWGKYLCSLGEEVDGECKKWGTETTKEGDTTITREICVERARRTQYPTYNEKNCINNKSTGAKVRGNHDCVVGQVIPPEDDITCVLQKTIVDNKDDPVQRDWLWADYETETGANIRVGCASSALESSKLFRSRKKQASIDIETLEKIIAQDASASVSRRNNDRDYNTEQIKYCAVGDREYAKLQKWVATKGLPANVCMSESAALRQIKDDGKLPVVGEITMKHVEADENNAKCEATGKNTCDKVVFKAGQDWSKPYNDNCCAPVDAILCMNGGGNEWESGECKCKNIKEKYRADRVECMTDEDYCALTGQVSDGSGGCKNKS